jgi:GMP synthase-like glutamine amidotransferase
MSSDVGGIRSLLVSHEAEAAPAVIGELLAARGVAIDRHVVLAADGSADVAFPALDGYDLVVSFGSFHNAYDPRARGWVDAEVDLIRRVVAADLPFLGVCFGGQLLGIAVGGGVERAPEGGEEVGVLTLEPVAGPLPIPAGPWFTWHEDRVSLPDDVDVLARTDKAIQVFRKGRAIGVQFHPEVDADLVTDWLRIGEHHLPDGWTSDRLLAVWADAEPQAHLNCAQLVDWLLAEVVGTPP